MRRTWNLLLVDDSPDDRADARQMLLSGSDHRFVFREAETGAAAVRAVQESLPDCVLLDYSLPDMDATQVLMLLAGADGLPVCPVVVLTGADSQGNGGAVLRAGAQDFIGKDWLTPQGLIRALENAAERWAMAVELKANQAALQARERELQSLADNSPDVLTRFDRDLRHLFVNSAVERATGRARADFLGKTSRELGMPPEQCDLWEGVLRKVFETGQPHFMEFDFEQGGQVRSYAARVVPEFAADGSVAHVLGLSQDVTLQRRAAAAIEESEARLSIALAGAGAGAWSWDLGQGLMTWSPESYALYGADPGALHPVHALWQQRVHPDDRERVESQMRDTIEGRTEEFSSEFRVSQPERGERWLLALGRAQRGAHGQAQKMFGIHLDITERRQLEAALRDQDRRKDEFLATLAHELRNPLAPLRTGLEVLMRSGGDPLAAQRIRDMMQRQMAHMVRLIDDLLDISRIRLGKVLLQRGRIDLHRAIEQAVEIGSPMIAAAGHEFETMIPGEPIWVEGDLVRLAQVLGNLLNNAAKYTLEKGRITLSAAIEGGQVVVRVTDTGVGIAEPALQTVFDLFSQLSTTVERAQGGLGIGLSLVKSLVELHGGSVSASSAGLGRGSTFTVRLPLAAPMAPAIDTEGSAAEPAADGARRILVIDDNVDGADTLSLLLSMGGHETRTAYNGSDGLRANLDFRPHVVFLDVGLPDMTGYEVARRIRSDSTSSLPLLVAVTGWAAEEDKRKAREAGFDLHMTKPVNPAAVELLLASYPGPAP